MAIYPGTIKASRREPCPICGRTDWCMWSPSKSMDGGYAYFCHRVKSDTIGVDGRNYIYTGEAGEAGSLFFEQSYYNYSRQKYAEEHGYTYTSNEEEIRKFSTYIKEQYEMEPIEVECDDIPRYNVLDYVYRAFLSVLNLEEEHEKMLRDEWGGLYEQVIQIHPIKSLPIPDYIRYHLKDCCSYRNNWRKKIMENLINIIGSSEKLHGIPGFYQKDDGTYTFSFISGIIFPVYRNGLIIRLRVRDNFPDIKGNFNGVKGMYYHNTDKDNFGWYFISEEDNISKNYDKAVCVYDKVKNIIKINIVNGMPAGKAVGKYKNFSSFSPQKVGDVWVNKYKHGAQSFSQASLYCKADDNFSVVYFTEGEKKAIIANIILKAPVVSLPGVGQISTLVLKSNNDEESIMDILKSKDCYYSVLCYDADKLVNVEVLKAEKKALELLKKYDLVPYVGEWDSRFGKGFDDILLEGVTIQYYPYEDIV